jgi:hypothetical protein
MAWLVTSSISVGVTGNIDRGRFALTEASVTHLHPAGDELDDQQPIGDVPDRGAVAVRIGDLHACFVEVLDGALAAGRLGIRLGKLAGEGVRPPHPGAADLARGDRLVGAFPDAAEKGIGRIFSRCLHDEGRREQADGND